jgi:endoglucanase
VGVGGGAQPNDHYCWERPEDLDHFRDTRRSAIAVSSGSDLAGEMAAALSAASIVFKDEANYSRALVRGAEALYAFAKLRPTRFSDGLPSSERAFYNSSHFNDDLIWGSTWLYFATGNLTYLGDATIRATDNSNREAVNSFGLLDWDNKLMGAQVLVTAQRLIFSVDVLTWLLLTSIMMILSPVL